jgi:hypothetical protein
MLYVDSEYDQEDRGRARRKFTFIDKRDVRLVEVLAVVVRSNLLVTTITKIGSMFRDYMVHECFK